MERHLAEVKQRTKFKTKGASDKTYVNAGPLTARALLECKTEHGCKSVHELHPSMRSIPLWGDGYDPGAADADTTSYFLFKGKAFTDRTTTLFHGADNDTVRRLVRVAVKRAVKQGVRGWCATPSTEDVYKTLTVTAYSKALTPDGAISSAGHLQKGRACASTFVHYNEGVCYVLFFHFIRKRVPPGQETADAEALRVAVTLKLPRGDQNRSPRSSSSGE